MRVRRPRFNSSEGNPGLIRLDLRNRATMQHTCLFLGLAAWGGLYILGVRFLSTFSLENEVGRLVVFACQSTAYVALPVLLLLPLTVVPLDRKVRVAGIVLAVIMMAFRFCWPMESIIAHLLRDLSLITLAVIFGGLLGWKVAENGHIVPAFIVLFVIDVWSVFFGLSRVIAQTPTVTRHVLLGSPVVGFTEAPIPIIRPLLGPVDVLILVACIAMAVKFRLGLLRALTYLVGGVLVCFLFVGFLGRPLPLLPFLVTAVAIGLHRGLHWDPPRILTAVGFSAFLVGILTVVTHLRVGS